MKPDTNPTAGAPATSEEPVAYDKQGRPLYLHPTAASSTSEAQPPQPQSVYMSRPLEPHETAIPPHIQERHEKSCKEYPKLNLSGGEYVISSVRRHPIGLVWIWLTALGLMTALFAVLAGALSGSSGFGFTSEVASIGIAGLVIVAILIVIGALVASYVYNNNSFYLTNESVVQEIQSSLFNRREQTVSLSNIEDASYHQDGIFAYMFNYGTIRLSTEGDETTYRFNYVANPKQHIAVLNDAVESFKNGRPVEPPHQDQPS